MKIFGLKHNMQKMVLTNTPIHISCDIIPTYNGNVTHINCMYTNKNVGYDV